jgi:hypothetical protein
VLEGAADRLRAPSMSQGRCHSHATVEAVKTSLDGGQECSPKDYLQKDVQDKLGGYF